MEDFSITIFRLEVVVVAAVVLSLLSLSSDIAWEEYDSAVVVVMDRGFFSNPRPRRLRLRLRLLPVVRSFAILPAASVVLVLVFPPAAIAFNTKSPCRLLSTVADDDDEDDDDDDAASTLFVCDFCS